METITIEIDPDGEQNWTANREFVKKITDNIQQSVSRILVIPPEVKKNYLEGTKKIQSQTLNSLLIVSKFGWFFDLDSPFLFPLEIADKFNKNEVEDANSELLKYYKSNLSKIILKLNKRHPERIDIFNQLKKCIDTKLYFAVIPLIITQIDGICFELTRKKFFIRQKNSGDKIPPPEVYADLTELTGNMLNALLAPIKKRNHQLMLMKNGFRPFLIALTGMK